MSCSSCMSYVDLQKEQVVLCHLLLVPHLCDLCLYRELVAQPYFAEQQHVWEEEAHLHHRLRRPPHQRIPFLRQRMPFVPPLRQISVGSVRGLKRRRAPWRRA